MRNSVPALFFLIVALTLPPIATANAQSPALAARPAMADPVNRSIPPDGRIDFRVVRDEVDIGSHKLAFRRDGERLIVEVAIDLNVTFLGVSLYRYVHRATETWQGDRLLALETVTDNNGKPFKVSGRATEAGFAVSTGAGESLFPADAMPSSHWNRSWVDGRPLINTQNGERISFTAGSKGQDNVQTTSGPMSAEHFAIAGGLRKDIWFDGAGQWVKTRFDGPDGTSIAYVRQQ